MSILIFGIVLMTALWVSCDKKETIVAEFGPHTITLSEFRLAYLQLLKQPDVFDSPSLREHYLDELIDRRLTAAWSDVHEPVDEKVLLRINAYHDKCLRDAHYKSVIAPQVTVDSQLVKKVYAFTTQRRKLKHLFAENNEQAERLYQRLQNGEDWDKLAEEVYTDDIMKNNSGELGWVHWDQLEFDMAMAAFTQPHKTFTKPVKSSYGWHILYIDNYEINPLLSEDDFNLHQNDIRLLVTQRLGDRIASDYINKMMTGIDIKVRPDIMKKVGQHLEQTLTRKPNVFDKMENFQLTEQEQRKIEGDLWQYRNEAIVIIGDNEMTVSWLMGSLAYIPYEALYKSFKTTLDFAIRDFVITKEARQMQLDGKFSEVNERTGIFAEYSKQIMVRRKLVKNTRLSDDEIYNYYEANRDELFKSVSFEETKEQIKQILLAKKQRENVSKFIQNLRQQNPIKKNIQSIHDYYN
ncbi:MAG: peptidylprolyl isomerase, partial [Calditrichaceae bacterium]|nr:peptidylprolyl isomerase [Calditrichaceae bacterium]